MYADLCDTGYDAVDSPKLTFWSHLLRRSSRTSSIPACNSPEREHAGQHDPNPIRCETGHPSLSMPVAEAESLPVGVMVTAKWWSDSRTLALARTYERAHGWLTVTGTTVVNTSSVVRAH